MKHCRLCNYLANKLMLIQLGWIDVKISRVQWCVLTSYNLDVDPDWAEVFFDQLCPTHRPN